MPGMGGIEPLSPRCELTPRHRRITLLHVFDRTPEKYICCQPWEAGGDDYLVKPLSTY